MNDRLIMLLLHFGTALTVSLAITPLVRSIGAKLGALDQPNERKVHLVPIPRVGGAAMFLSFWASLLTIYLFFDLPISHPVVDKHMGLFAAGGLILFGIGLLDDFHRISHRIKFLFQVLGATFAYMGGVQITAVFGIAFPDFYGVVSYVATVFWFVLFINALNLIDGLDGLAAGIAFFTSAVMAITTMLRGAVFDSFVFGALAGACLGFLRYNFNPASIFMGDSGSYFLGYVIAGISLLNSSKSEVGAVILIPLVSMGVPIFDTILAPIRRFIMGKRMFRPDTGHIHHRLVSLGFSTRKAVTLIYMISIVLCVTSLLLINLQNQGIGILLASLAVVAFLFMRKLGYLQHVDTDRICGWIRDLSDEAGLSQDRRSFLSMQLEICESENIRELWHNTCRALTMLDFDMSKIKISRHLGHTENASPEHQDVGQRNMSSLETPATEPYATETGCQAPPFTPTDSGWGCEIGTGIQEVFLDSGQKHAGMTKGHSGQRILSSGAEDQKRDAGAAGHDIEFVWTYNGFDSDRYLSQPCMFKLELPLLDELNQDLGTLWLVKDLKRSGFSHYTLKRVEHLRRSVTRSLKKLNTSTM